MRELALLTFVTLDGVMQAPHSSDEDTAGGFASAGNGTLAELTLHKSGPAGKGGAVMTIYRRASI